MIPARFTETNTPLLAIAGAVLALGAAAMAAGVPGPLPGILALGGAVPLLLGHTLQVSVDEDGLEVRLGVGLFRTQIPAEDLGQIRSTEVARAPWLGMRRRARETIYAVGTRPAVGLELEGGRSLIIGLHQSGELLAALRSLQGRSAT